MSTMAVDMSADPFAGLLERSTVAQALRDARASLARPTRPITPMDRSLFQYSEGPETSRPSSGYSISSLKFVGDTFSPSGSLASTTASMSSTLRSSRLSDRCTPIQEYEEMEPDFPTAGADVATFDENGEVVGEYHGSCPDGDAIMPCDTSFAPPPPDVDTRRKGKKEKKSKKEKKGRTYVDPENEEYDQTAADELAMCMDVPLPSDEDSDAEDLGMVCCRVGSGGSRQGSAGGRSEAGGEAARMWLASCQKTMAELDYLGVAASEESPITAGALEPQIDRVWKLIADLRGKRRTHRSQAPKLLRALLSLMDKKAEALGLLRVARCVMEILGMQSVRDDVGLSGAQAAQLNVVKALFKLSKEDSHDDHFVKEGLLDSLLAMLCNTGDRASLMELWIFTLGTLRNVTNSEDSQQALGKAGALLVLQTLLHEEEISPHTGSAKEVQLLVQVMGLLRNLAAPAERHAEFLELGMLADLASASARFPQQEEVQVNYSRILSRLSEDDDICEALCEDPTHLRRIVECIGSHSGSARLVSRMTFVLGNMTARSERVRRMFILELGGDALLDDLAVRYWQRDRKLAQAEAARPCGAEGERSEEAEECEAVLVKLVRLMANAAMSEATGPLVAGSAPVVDLLLDILGCKKMPQSEELVLNAVSAATNLSFYDTPENLLLVAENAELLCRQLRPLLLESYNAEALSEAARALGNLSRRADVRQWIRELRMDEVLAILLAHDDRDLVLYACGTLVNMAADGGTSGRLLCRNHDLHVKLASVIRDAPEDDGDLIAVAVKVLANLCLGRAAEADASEPPICSEWSESQMEAVTTCLERVCEGPELADTVAEQPGLLDLSYKLLDFLASP